MKSRRSAAAPAIPKVNSRMKIVDDRLPREGGSYLLLLRLPAHQTIAVGALGRIAFVRGWYAYSGSAFGPGGLAARLGRHLDGGSKRHWHIDYLRAAARVVEAWMAVGAPCREHEWAQALTKDRSAGKAVVGFGSSDCRCRSHLICFHQRPNVAWLGQRLGTAAVRLRLTPAKAAAPPST
jgi:Uri superfamily endonuclease